MKVVFAGKYENEDQLPVGELPENAVRFREPESMNSVVAVGMLKSMPFWLVAAGMIALSVFIHKGFFELKYSQFLIGVLLSLACSIPHELLHGICFGKEAEVEIYYSLKLGMLFVVSTYPISKWRFIWMSLCPNLIFGWIPLILYTFIPIIPVISPILFWQGILSITMGCVDYMNVIHAFRQMPKGSMQQLSGLHSYWFMPKVNQPVN